MLMELLFDLKDESALKAKEKPQKRLREYAELATYTASSQPFCSAEKMGEAVEGRPCIHHTDQ